MLTLVLTLMTLMTLVTLMTLIILMTPLYHLFLPPSLPLPSLSHPFFITLTLFYHPLSLSHSPFSLRPVSERCTQIAEEKTILEGSRRVTGRHAER